MVIPVSGYATNRELRAVPTYNIYGEQFMTTEEIERFIRANVGKTVCVISAAGEMENLLVHKVDGEGFVCDLAAEIAQPPACAYWVRFTDVSEVRPAGDESTK
jgi:hypothetical protein